MARAEALWTHILGVLLILLGITLFAARRVSYTVNEKIGNTRYAVKREKTIVVPRPVSLVVIALGGVAMVLANRKMPR